MAQPQQTFEAGQRVRVTQQIPQRDEVWQTHVEGEIVGYEQKKTGSWFAHAKDDKLWLDRLTLRKDDGEIVVCNLDEFTHVDLLPAAPTAEDEAADDTEAEGEADADDADKAEG